MDYISKRHYNCWNRFSDSALQRHFLFIIQCGRDESLKVAMNKLMADRGLKIIDPEIVNEEFKKAMQTRYTTDDELLDRVYDRLYGVEK